MDKMSKKETSDIQTYLASFNKEIECEDLDNVDSGDDNCQPSDAECGNEETYYYVSGDEVKHIDGLES